jgi:Flp pilus assembly protein TadD
LPADLLSRVCESLEQKLVSVIAAADAPVPVPTSYDALLRRLLSEPCPEQFGAELYAAARNNCDSRTLAQWSADFSERLEDSPAAFLFLGLVACRQGDFDQALSRFESGTTRFPDSLELHVQKAIALWELELDGQAFSILRRIAFARDDDLRAQIRVSQNLRQFGLFDEALDLVKAQLLRHPDVSNLIIEYAHTVRHLSGEATTRDVLDAAIRRDPGSSTLQLHLARVLFAMEDVQGAASILIELTSRRKNDLTVWSDLVAVLRKMGAVTSASALVAKLQVRYPEYPDLDRHRGLLERDAGSDANAVSAFEAGLNKDQKRFDIVAEKVVSLRRLGHALQGLDVLETFRPRRFDRVRHTYLRVGLMRQMGRFELAQQEIERASCRETKHLVIGLPKHQLPFLTIATQTSLSRRSTSVLPFVNEMLERASGIELPPNSLEGLMPTAPALLVFGMHRSGTSALVHDLVSRGAVVPGHPLPGGLFYNREGHFEPLEIVGFHNKLLRKLDSAWHAVAPLRSQSPDADLTTDDRDLLARILMQMGVLAAKDQSLPLDRPPTFAIKDPRMCRFSRLWTSLIAQFPLELRPVILLRSPSDVAVSLARRDGLAIDHSMLLWARYYQELLTGLPSPVTATWLIYEEIQGRDIDDLAGDMGLCARVDAPLFSSAAPSARIDGRVQDVYDELVQRRDLRAFERGLSEILRTADEFQSILRRFDAATVLFSA